MTAREIDFWRAAPLALRRKYYFYLRLAGKRPSPLSPIEAKVEALLADVGPAQPDETIALVELRQALATVRERERDAAAVAS